MWKINFFEFQKNPKNKNKLKNDKNGKTNFPCKLKLNQIKRKKYEKNKSKYVSSYIFNIILGVFMILNYENRLNQTNRK